MKILAVVRDRAVVETEVSAPDTVADDLTHYEATRDVNSVRNNRPHLIEPLP